MINSVRDYVENMRRKPAHVRERAAFIFSVAVTSIISLAWLVSLSTSGKLAVNFQNPAPEATTEFTTATNNSLLGGAAAFSASSASENNGLTVVETHASSSLDQSQTGEQTAIPF